MRLIDADTIVTVQTFDPEHEEYNYDKMTLADALDLCSEEGCPPIIDAIPVEVAAKKLQRSFHSENWESWAEWLRGNYTDEDYVAHKDDKRNAIPVEWMASWINRHPNDLRCAWFASLEMEWRKEQEAQDG